MRDAIEVGGGPHTFACDAPTVVTTEATLEIDNDVILDGEGNLIVDGNESHQVFSVRRGIAAELLNLTVTRGYAVVAGAGIWGYDASRPVEGGDLWLSSLGLIDIWHCTISGNTARRGAGIYSIALRMTAWNSTISGNVASEEGGALYIGGTTLGASTIYLNANTIVGNTAPQGSALLGTGETPTVRFAGNIVEGDCRATDGTVTWASEGSNIESPDSTCDFTQPSDRVGVTSGELNLGPLADNGGETETHLPLIGSVAIDMIPAEQCGEVLPVFPLWDQRVVNRPRGVGCDVGSVEVVPEP